MNKGSRDLGLMVFIENAQGIVKSEIKKRKKKRIFKEQQWPRWCCSESGVEPSCQILSISSDCQAPGSMEHGTVWPWQPGWQGGKERPKELGSSGWFSIKSLTVYTYLPRDKRGDSVLSWTLVYSGTTSKKYVITKVLELTSLFF